ncbi:MAG: uroporphyrinogen decarboxylase family protein, partial [Thermoanaerobaculia bacterium]|nr:uroporphyrinogen decarboxylase family protein [Thermoanaerobaculia bacterium]
MPSEKFQNALNRIPQPVPPVWFMRQAGRYHRHYQELRKKHSFMELCKEPELAAEVAFGPVDDFDFDVSILFSDLLFPLQALGLSLEYGDSGPQLDPKLDQSELKKLRSIDDALPHLEFQREAMKKTRERIPDDKSVIGFVGGPWTLFVYAVEGSHKGNLIDVKTATDLYRAFSDQLVPLLIENIRLQLDGGAEIVMIFDTAAGEVSPAWFHHWIA